MKIDEISELFNLISRGVAEIPSRQQAISLRKNALNINNGFVKIAFDTRRIDQGTELIPRRGLQNYNRSDAFLSQAMGEKIKSFAKLKDVLESLKEIYGAEPEWQDSNARVLLSHLQKALRTGINDGDFTDSQPGVGNLSFLEELIQVRYKIIPDNLNTLASSDLKRVILSKDEELIRKDVNSALEIKKKDVVGQSYDSLIEKLLEGCKASKDSPNVERTITITIKDSILDK